MRCAPCKGCTERRPGCHGSCEKYRQWKAERDTVVAWLKNQHPEASEMLRNGFIKKQKQKNRVRRHDSYE